MDFLGIATMDIKTAFLLPQSILDEQVCKECLNYLSVGPVMITKDNKTICGRCVKNHEDVDSLKASLYNKLAESCVFSCINRYDGCNEILLFNEALKHESTCTGQIYVCHVCSFLGNGCQFIQHFKKDHPRHFLSRNIFSLNLTRNCTRKFIYNDIRHIYLLLVMLKAGVLKVAVDIQNIPPNRRKTLRYTLRFFKSNFKIGYHTEPLEYKVTENNREENWFQIDITDLLLISSTEIMCEFNATLDATTDLEEEDYKLKQKYLKWEENVRERERMIRKEEAKMVVEKNSLENPYNAIKKIVGLFYRSSFNCINCNSLIVDKLNIFVCPQSHVACPNCLKDYCNVCKTNCNWINCKTLLQDLELYCDWQNCVVRSKIHQFIFHKQGCKHRQYKCPLDGCNLHGIKEDFISHWHSDLSTLILENCRF